MMRHVFTFHSTTKSLVDHWTPTYSTTVEHVAVVVAIVHEEPRSIVGYWALDVPNRARKKRDAFTIRRYDVEERIESLFPGGRPMSGITAGLVAVMHTHPHGSSVMPSREDLRGLAPFTLGIVSAIGRKTARWYDCHGIIARPAAIAPHASWRLSATEGISAPCSELLTTVSSTG